MRERIWEARSSRNLFQCAYRCRRDFSSYTYTLQLLDCCYQNYTKCGFWILKCRLLATCQSLNTIFVVFKAAAICHSACASTIQMCGRKSHVVFLFLSLKWIIVGYSVKTFFLKNRVQPIYFCIVPCNVSVTKTPEIEISSRPIYFLILFGNFLSGSEENCQNHGDKMTPLGISKVQIPCSIMCRLSVKCIA